MVKPPTRPRKQKRADGQEGDGATEQQQQQEVYTGIGMAEVRCDTVQHTPHNLKEPATMDRKLPEKKTE
jgi:hypothetical protein